MIGKSERRMVRLAHVVLIVFSLMAVLPFILLISSSLTEENAALKYGFSFVPRVFSLAAYKYISYQSKMIIRAYGITIFTTVVGTSVGLTMTSMLGYGLSKEIPGRRILNFFVVFTMLFNGGLVPTYLVYTKYLHLSNTIWALIIPSLLMNAFHVMLVRNYFSTSIPESLIESAKLDGASEMMIFRAIVLPLSKPIMATIGLMLALSYWNNWTNGLYYLDDTSLYSIQNVLNAINNNIIAINSVSNMGLAINKSEIPALTARMAIAVIGILPMLCIYPFFQKYFVKGITIGAVKG
ncbi:MAG: carbohydrate ABC transporter permease [Lachnospiraceae bacterium]|nr:carbohydrate ABC transporter permease [Lachnospiraceae bacterium Marseille-Q4251]